MLRNHSSLAMLIDTVSQTGMRNQSKEAIRLVDQFLSKSDEDICLLAIKSLLEALPPEQGGNLVLRLRILGTYWALALVYRGFPSLDTAQIRVDFIRRSFRLGHRMKAEMIRNEHFGHLELFEVLEDRFWALSQIPGMIRELSTNRDSQNAPVFLEPVIIGGTFKASLRNALLRHYARMLDRRKRQRLLETLNKAINMGFLAPWRPELHESDRKERGIDIMLTDGLAAAGPLSISSLMNKVISRRVIETNEQIGFIEGLTRNEHFRQSTDAIQDSL